MRFGIRAATAKHKNAEAISSRMGGMTFGEKWHTFFFLSTAARRGESGGRGKEINVGKKGGEGGKGGYLSCFWCCEMNETGPFDERGPE